MCGNTTAAAEKSFVLREPEVNIPKAPHSILHVEWLGVCSCKRNYLGGDGSAFWEANPLTCSCIIMTTQMRNSFALQPPFSYKEGANGGAEVGSLWAIHLRIQERPPFENLFKWFHPPPLQLVAKWTGNWYRTQWISC